MTRLSTTPRLLDLYCCQGGASEGYRRAGFEVVGVDLRPQPRYPFEFHQADALTFPLSGFDAVAASPPCQAHSIARNIAGAERHVDLIAATRRRLAESGLPYIIENVPGAPLLDPVLVCGLSLGLNVKRHRLFESNVPLVGTECGSHGGDWVTVFGGGAPAKPDNRRRAAAAQARAAMGIGWMTRDGLSQAIPPAYTEHIGRQLLAHIEAAAR